MMRFFVLMCFCLVGNALSAQVLEVPLSGNPVLQSAFEELTSAPADYRSFEQARAMTNDDTLTVQLAVNATATACVDTNAVVGTVVSITDIGCSFPVFGSAILVDDCLTYTAGNFTGVEEYCMEVCYLLPDTTTQCLTTLVQFEITPGSTSLPFFDDFSSSQIYPDANLWSDNFAFINNTMSDQAPSLGMATLDGLAADGFPYNEFQGYGQTDILTSKRLPLAGMTAADNIVMSCYLQRGGLGDRPEDADSLFIEFLDNSNTWVKVAAFGGDTLGSNPNALTPFFFVSAAIDQAEFFHNNFQFRFRKFGSLQGIQDIWNIDYVFVDDNRFINNPFNDDIAWTKPPQSMLKNYTAMPWRHFEGNETAEIYDSLQFGLWNHFPSTEEIFTRQLEVTESISGGSYMTTSILTDNTAPTALGNIEAGYAITVDKPINASDLSSFISSISSILLGVDSARLVMNYSFSNTGQTPISPLVTNNDQAQFEMVFKEYFAQDDGSAESGIVAFGAGGSAGSQFATKYHFNVADSIQAIQLHFPHYYGDQTLQLFNIKIYYNDLNSTPIYQENFERPVYTNEFNGITTYSLGDSVKYVPANTDVYIAFQQASPSSTPIIVGLDKNYDRSQNQFFNVGGGWTPLTVQGAIMMRVVTGGERQVTTSTNSINQVDFSVFPNPVNDRLQIEVDESKHQDVSINIFSADGRLVLNQAFNSQIDVSTLQQGSYYLSLINNTGEQIGVQQFVIIR